MWTKQVIQKIDAHLETKYVEHAKAWVKFPVCSIAALLTDNTSIVTPTAATNAFIFSNEADQPINWLCLNRAFLLLLCSQSLSATWASNVIVEVCGLSLKFYYNRLTNRHKSRPTLYASRFESNLQTVQACSAIKSSGLMDSTTEHLPILAWIPSQCCQPKLCTILHLCVMLNLGLQTWRKVPGSVPSSTCNACIAGCHAWNSPSVTFQDPGVACSCATIIDRDTFVDFLMLHR